MSPEGLVHVRDSLHYLRYRYAHARELVLTDMFGQGGSHTDPSPSMLQKIYGSQCHQGHDVHVMQTQGLTTQMHDGNSMPFESNIDDCIRVSATEGGSIMHRQRHHPTPARFRSAGRAAKRNKYATCPFYKVANT